MTCAGFLQADDSHFSYIFTCNVVTSAYVRVFDLIGERFARTNFATFMQADDDLLYSRNPAWQLEREGGCAYPLEVERGKYMGVPI